MSDVKKWYEKFVKPIGVNMWAPEWYHGSIREFDADKLALMIKACGSTVGFTFQGFSQDHFGVSFFQTELGHKHANLRDGRDHMAEYQTALKKVGAKYFAYYCCLQDRNIWDKNPDWRVIDNNGNDGLADNFGILCVNSPYRDHLIDRLAEISEKYKPDGWILDMFVQDSTKPVCHCDYCKRKYRLQFGLDLPTDPPNAGADWRRFIQWRYNCVFELYKDVVKQIKLYTPETVITHNAFGYKSGDEWTSAENYNELFTYDDVATYIVSAEYWHGDKQCRSSDLWWQAGHLTRVFRGLSQKPVWMQLGRFMYSRDYTIVPERDLEIAVFSIIANGGCPFIIDNVFPEGTVDPVAVERLANVYNKIGAKEKYLDYETELCQTGVLYSKSSKDWNDLATPGQSRYGHGFLGLCKTLVECHIPYRVIKDDCLTAEKLEGLKCLILSECVILSDQTARTIKEFVEKGGVLICMGKTGIVDGYGNYLCESQLSDVLGVSFREPLNYKVSFVVPGDNEICASADKRQILPLRECYPERFDISEGARQVMASRMPATEVIPKKRVFTYGVDVAPGHREEPFAVINNYGKGRAMYLGGNIARDYGIYGNPDVKKLLDGVFAWGAASPFKTDAPGFVEMACYKIHDRYVLHLINYAVGQLRATNYAGGYALDQAVPVHNINISVSLDGFIPKSVFLEDGTPLEFKADHEYVKFMVPVVDTHLLVIME